jgi:hypothetical protein
MFYIDPSKNLPKRYDIAKFLEYLTPPPVSEGPVFDVLASYFWNKVPDLLLGGNYLVVGEANRPDLISYRIYGDTQYYWIIMLYNGISFNEDVVMGLTLNYPSLKDLEDLYFKLNSLQTNANAAAILAAEAPTPAVTLDSIVISPSAPSLAIGATLAFTATGTYSDGTIRDVTSQVIWATTLAAIATINSNGVVTAISVGTVTISCSLNMIEAGIPLIVTTVAVTPQLIFLAPAGQSIPHGSVIQFSATMVFSDGTAADITSAPGVVWASSNATAATVNSNGLVSTHNPGSTIISCTLGSLVGAMPLIVT